MFLIFLIDVVQKTQDANVKYFGILVSILSYVIVGSCSRVTKTAVANKLMLPIKLKVTRIENFGAQVSAERIVFPPDSRVANVKDFGAKGYVITDDTAAIQKAITKTSDEKTNNSGTNLIYFPNGTYLVSQTLLWPSLSYFGRVFQGQNQDGTSIKLKNNAAGFGDSESPKAVLSTFEGDTTGNAFRHSIYNLTVDVGSGNPGAEPH